MVTRRARRTSASNSMFAIECRQHDDWMQQQYLVEQRHRLVTFLQVLYRRFCTRHPSVYLLRMLCVVDSNQTVYDVIAVQAFVETGKLRVSKHVVRLQDSSANSTCRFVNFVFVFRFCL
jgi:hypothetical protein